MPSTDEYAAAAVQEGASSEAKYGLAHDFLRTMPIASALTSAAPGLASAQGSGTDPSIATSQGSIQYHLFGHNPDDPKYRDIMLENADNLLGMGGLVYDYMKRLFPSISPEALDIDTWLRVISNLPDLSICAKTQKTYVNRLAGTSIPGEFLSLLAKGIIRDNAKLLPDFTSSMQSNGDRIFNASGNRDSYTVLTFSLLNYLVDDGIGGYYDYGAIILRQVNFLEFFTQLKAICASPQYASINIEYTEITALVQTRRIRRGGPDHSSFRSLINTDATNRLLAASNFFNGGNIPQSQIRPIV